MNGVDRLFEQFVAEHRSGAAVDVGAHLARAEGTDREELAVLIDGFLARAPRRPFDAAAFEGSAAEQLAARLSTSLGDSEPHVQPQTGPDTAEAQEVRASAEGWPQLLPRLRERSQIRRSDLVERLAGVLGVAGREEKVASYYHRMEQGSLPPQGVSRAVLDALATLLNTSAEALCAAGEATTGPAAAAQEGVFARASTPDPAYGAGSDRAVRDTGPDAERDQVDRLFCDG